MHACMHAELPIPLIMRAVAWDPDGVRTGGAGGLESGPRRSSSRAAANPTILAPFQPGRLDPILPHESLNQIPLLAPSIMEDAALANVAEQAAVTGPIPRFPSPPTQPLQAGKNIGALCSIMHLLSYF